jgi:hypothetical protein
MDMSWLRSILNKWFGGMFEPLLADAEYKVNDSSFEEGEGL